MNEEFINVRAQIDLLHLAEGFFQSTIIFALIKLDIFEHIGAQGASASVIAHRIGSPEPYVNRLLNGGVAIGILELDAQGCYSIRDCFQNLLLNSGKETYLVNWLRNLDYLHHAMSKLDQTVREGKPAVDPMLHLGHHDQATREFTLAMHNYASFRGKELAHFLDVAGVNSLLDVGCGPGTYAFNLGKVNPKMHLFLADLPGVLEVTRELMGSFSIENPVTFLPLDVLREDIPGTYDLILVSNTLHMLGEQASLDLLKKLYPHINPGGSLVIQAQFLDANRAGRRWPVLLDLIQMCITQHGRNHTVEETKNWLESAGFENIEFQPMTLLNTNSYLRAFKS